MLAGGLLFLIGSILYLPQYASSGCSSFTTSYLTCSTLGTWVFRFGTLCYLSGSFISLGEQYSTGLMNSMGAGIIAYILGAVLYLAGGVLSQLSLPYFAMAWFAGSCLFFAGSLLFHPSLLPPTSSPLSSPYSSFSAVTC